jgi:hypothetical protein
MAPPCHHLDLIAAHQICKGKPLRDAFQISLVDRVASPGGRFPEITYKTNDFCDLVAVFVVHAGTLGEGFKTRQLGADRALPIGEIPYRSVLPALVPWDVERRDRIRVNEGLKPKCLSSLSALLHFVELFPIANCPFHLFRQRVHERGEGQQIRLGGSE